MLILFLFSTSFLSGIASPLPVPPLEPNTMAPIVDTLLSFSKDIPLIAPSGYRRNNYLSTIAGVVKWFLPFQNEMTGAIIDPNSHQEEEYSTPCFAHAAALLVSTGWSNLTDAALRALTWSAISLNNGKCATNHCDFFISPTLRAFQLLTPFVNASLVSKWTSLLSTIRVQTYELNGNKYANLLH